MDTKKYSLVIFGITGDLALKKLIPSLVKLSKKNLLPQNFKLIGIGRRDLTDEELEKIKSIDREFIFLQDDINNSNLFEKIQSEVEDSSDQLFYLATFPEVYLAILNNLESHNKIFSSSKNIKILVEKPIGEDYKSAKTLITKIEEIFSDDQIYLVDHYLGKVTVQNIFVFRFGNIVFENLINNQFLDHIEITAFEDFGISGRGRYYDKTGALKDFAQNHILQLLAFMTMEKPTDLISGSVHHSRLKLLNSIKPIPKSLSLGQYEGFVNEKDIAPNSQTDTFFEFKLEIDSPRFKGIPILIRGGKKLSKTLTEISLVFKKPQHVIFDNLSGGKLGDVLTFRIQPDEGISFKIMITKSDSKLESKESSLDYHFKNSADELPEAYEKLLLDALSGDQTFFPRPKEILAQWKIIDKLKKDLPKIRIYKEGSIGPDTSTHFLPLSNT